MAGIIDTLIGFLTGGDYGSAIMNSITEWLLEQAAEISDNMIFDFMDSFKPDISYFNQLFPNANTYYTVFITIGIILVVAIFSFTMLFNMLGVVTGMEENPIHIAIRTIISLFLVINSGLIMNYMFKIGMQISNLLGSISRNDGWASNIYQGFSTTTTTINSVLKLIFILIILWKMAMLLLEVIERYLAMCLFWYLSPLANATFVSKGTSKIFSTFYTGALMQVLICCLNIWFLRMASDLIITQMNLLSTGQTSNIILIGLIIIGWLEVARRIDQYLRSMGFGVVQTGGNLGRSVAGTIMSMGYAVRMAAPALKGATGVSNGLTGMRDVFGKTQSSMGNKTVSDAAGLAQGVMSGSEHTVPNQDAFMSTDHRGNAAATIVGDAGKTVVANSNVPGMSSRSVKMDTLTAGATQGGPFKFAVNTTDGDRVSGHISRLPEENGVKGIESVGKSGEKQYTYFDKGSGLPTGTGLEKGQTSTLHDANMATATQTVNGEIDVNSGAWNKTTMEAIGFQETRSDDTITLQEKGRLEISDASGEKMGTVLTSSYEGFDAAKSLGNFHQDPLTGNQMVGIPESKLDGLSLDADTFAQYPGVREVVGENAVASGYETLESHGRQTYLKEVGQGRTMQYEIVTADNLDMSKLNTYKRMSLPNGGDVYYRARVATSETSKGNRRDARKSTRR